MGKYDGIRQRGKKGILQVEYYDASGKRIRCSAGTDDWEAAREYRDRLQREAWREGRLSERPAATWEQAVMRWVQEQGHKRSLKDDKMHLRWVRKYLDGKQLREITRPVLDRLAATKRVQGASNATVNRMTAVVRSILRRAERDWGWLDSAPAVRMLPEGERRVRWLTRDEAARLIGELPEHLAEMVRFTLATGLRESNVTGLTWAQIDLGRRTAWIHADQAKAKRAIAVPLNDDAVEIIRRQVGKHSEAVFTYRGHPISRCNNSAWRKALERVGIENFRFHDLRHTWASWHVQAGTPLHVLKELGGWGDYKMVLRYAHLGGQHLQEWAGQVTAPGTIPAQAKRGAATK